ncbi:hypothetical protein PVAP13_7NG001000 [Panicum virgatum]|uniref:RxLR effector protein n=1 Tax=Panicum virgatum TaxID=38727 RepID=A0A8T0Q275_PANVG|nr:hypothetical protein PVAP13_7NG001000 [Panicum virgatum]KAG2565237.1 hypothetical protein PVAP13_7NG001000 [Panicum virgatum]
MKFATAALLLLIITMMCTHANSHGIEAEETNLLAKSDVSNDGTSSASGVSLGRKLMAGSTIIDSASVSTTDSNHMMSVQQYRDFMGQFGRHP